MAQLRMKDVERIVRTSPYKFYEVGGKKVFPFIATTGIITAEVAIILYHPENPCDDGMQEGGPFAEGLQVWQKAITFTIKVSVLVEASEEKLEEALRLGNEEIENWLKGTK